MTKFAEHLPDLRSGDPHARNRAALAIRYRVEKESKELLSDARAALVSDLSQFIQMLSESSLEDKLACLSVVSHLIYSRFTVNMLPSTFFEGIVRTLIQDPSEPVFLEACSVAGEIATTEFKSPHFLRDMYSLAIRFCQDTNAQARYAGFVLFDHISIGDNLTIAQQADESFIHNVWVSITDQKPTLSNAAITCLVRILNAPTKRARIPILEIVCSRIFDALDSKHLYEVLGALNCLAALIRVTRKKTNKNLRGFFTGLYTVMLNAVFKLENARGFEVKLPVARLLPLFADYDIDKFTRRTQGKASDRLTSGVIVPVASEASVQQSNIQYSRRSSVDDQDVGTGITDTPTHKAVDGSPGLALQGSKSLIGSSFLDRSITFLTTHVSKYPEMLSILGRLCDICPEDAVFVHFPAIIDVLNSVLQRGADKKSTHVPEALKCIQLLAVGCPTLLSSHVRILLEVLFSAGLSPELTAALKELVSHLQNWVLDIQGMLLYLIGLEIGGINLYITNSSLACRISEMQNNILIVPTERTGAGSNLLQSAGGSYTSSTNDLTQQAATSSLSSLTPRITNARAAGLGVAGDIQPLSTILTFSRNINPQPGTGRFSRLEMLLIALQTLLEFNFDMFSLTLFASDYLLRFLTHENEQVRILTGLVLIKVLAPHNVRGSLPASCAIDTASRPAANAGSRTNSVSSQAKSHHHREADDSDATPNTVPAFSEMGSVIHRIVSDSDLSHGAGSESQTASNLFRYSDKHSSVVPPFVSVDADCAEDQHVWSVVSVQPSQEGASQTPGTLRMGGKLFSKGLRREDPAPEGNIVQQGRKNDVRRLITDYTERYMADETSNILKIIRQQNNALIATKNQVESAAPTGLQQPADGVPKERMTDPYSSRFKDMLIQDAVQKLVLVAVTDLSANVRRSLLVGFNNTVVYDTHLSHETNFRALFVALNDTDFSIRHQAVLLIGRLSSLNSSIVMPEIRQVVIQLLSDLRYRRDPKRQSMSNALLVTILRHCSSMVRPYLPVVYNAIITILYNGTNDEGLVITCLNVISEIFTVGGLELPNLLREVLPFIISCLKEEDSKILRLASIKAFYQIIEGSGFVVLPLFLYPELLPILTGILKNELSVEIRLETAKLLSSLGCVDPTMFDGNTQLGINQIFTISAIDTIHNGPGSGSANGAGGVSGDGDGVTSMGQGHLRGMPLLNVNDEAERRFRADRLADMNADASRATDLSRYQTDLMSNMCCSDLQICECVTSNVFSKDFLYNESNIWANHKSEGKITFVLPPQIRSHGKAEFDAATGAIVDTHNIMRLSSDLPTDSLQLSDEGHYTKVVYEMLTNILMESTLENYHKDAIMAIRCIMQSDRNLKAAGLAGMVPHILKITRNSNVYTQELLLQEVILITNSLERQVKAYAADLFNLADSLWPIPHLTMYCIALVEELCLVLAELSFFDFNRNIIVRLMALFGLYAQPDSMSGVALSLGKHQAEAGAANARDIGLLKLSDADHKLTIRALRTVVMLAPILEDQVQLLVPTILSAAASTRNTFEIRVAFLDCLERLSVTVDLTKLSSMIIQQVLSIIREPLALTSSPDTSRRSSAGVEADAGSGKALMSKAVAFKAFETLHLLLVQFGFNAVVHVAAISDTLIRTGFWSPLLDAILTLIVRGTSVDFYKFIQLVTQWRAVSQVHFGSYSAVLAGFAEQFLVHTSPTVSATSLFKKSELNINQLLLHLSARTLDTTTGSLFVRHRPVPPGPIGAASLDLHAADLQKAATMEYISIPRQVWSSDECRRPEDWRIWLSKLSLTLLRASPIRALRNCYNIATIYQRIAKELFNYAFVAAITDTAMTSSDLKNHIVESLKYAFMSPDIPIDVLQALLDLAEFWEHRANELSTIFHHEFLGRIADRCHAYARSLRYKESIYTLRPKETTESLIAINYHLGYSETSQGVLKYEIKRLNFIVTTLLNDIFVKSINHASQEISKLSFPLQEAPQAGVTGLTANASASSSTSASHAGLQLGDPTAGPSHLASDFVNESLFQDMVRKAILKPLHTIISNEIYVIKNSQTMTLPIPTSIQPVGTIGGVFLDGRPLNAGPESTFQHVDYHELAMFLYSRVTALLQDRLSSGGNPFAVSHTSLILAVLIDQMHTLSYGLLEEIFAPQPKWFERLCLWDRSLVGYNKMIQQFEGKLAASNASQQQQPPPLSSTGAATFGGSVGISMQRTLQPAPPLPGSGAKPVQLSKNDKKNLPLLIVSVATDKIKCLYALGEYTAVLSECERVVSNLTVNPVYTTILSDTKKRDLLAAFYNDIAKSCSYAALELGDKSLSFWLGKISPDDIDYLIISAIRLYKSRRLLEAYYCINKMRSKIDANLVATFSESYARSYSLCVILQSINDLQEIILLQLEREGYKLDVGDTVRPFASDSYTQSLRIIPAQAIVDRHYNESQLVSRDVLDAASSDFVIYRAQALKTRILTCERLDDSQQTLKHFVTRLMWSRRLAAIKWEVDYWASILRVRCLLIPPEEDVDVWIRFSVLCHQNGRENLARRTLEGLLGATSRHTLQAVKRDKDSWSIYTRSSTETAVLCSDTTSVSCQGPLMVLAPQRPSTSNSSRDTVQNSLFSVTQQMMPEIRSTAASMTTPESLTTNTLEGTRSDKNMRTIDERVPSSFSSIPLTSTHEALTSVSSTLRTKLEFLEGAGPTSSSAISGSSGGLSIPRLTMLDTQTLPDRELSMLSSGATARALFDASIPQLPHDRPTVLYSYAKHLYASSPSLIDQLVAFVHLLRLANDKAVMGSNSNLLCRILIKLATWYSSLIAPVDQSGARIVFTGSHTESYTRPANVSVSAVVEIWRNLLEIANRRTATPHLSTAETTDSILTGNVELVTGRNEEICSAYLTNDALSVYDTIDGSENIGDASQRTEQISFTIPIDCILKKHGEQVFSMLSAEERSGLSLALPSSPKLAENSFSAQLESPQSRQRLFTAVKSVLASKGVNCVVSEQPSASAPECSTAEACSWRMLPVTVFTSRAGRKSYAWFQRAAALNPTSSKVWKCLGHTSYAIVRSMNSICDDACAPMAFIQTRTTYLVSSVISHFKCIETCRTADSLPTTLRLLTLWFTYGHIDEIEAEIVRGLAAVPINVWLDVIPQILARLHSPHPKIRLLVHQLLVVMGSKHPQSLVYPLTVSSKTSNVSRQAEALAILDQISRTNHCLVEESLLVSKELIRVAILWPELCFDLISQFSSAYYVDKNFQRMFYTLCMLHVQIARAPETPAEIVFNQSFRARLDDAWDKIKRYPLTSDKTYLQQAMNIYHKIHDAINDELPRLSTLDLQGVSPKLNVMYNTSLAIPGSYHPNRELVTINRFYNKISVIKSKQRPRKIALIGSDAEFYAFLLKGHEDLRQDERVMQLFGLVNNLLANHSYSSKRNMHITRYPSIPVSQNSGLLFWVPFSDTILDLIKQYRAKKNISINNEMQQMGYRAPQFKNLSLLHKLDAFKFAQSHSDGADLQRSIWDNAATSEIWLMKRMSYIRSMAIMSMMGYVLGLGDRHPANLMIERHSGAILHIDYGDLWEVAMKRKSLPETVPFRLTRIMINACEVCGIHGGFMITSKVTMSILRRDSDSLMAILETFIYDPLMSMKITEDTTVPGGVENVDDTENVKFYEGNHEEVRQVNSREAEVGDPERNPKAVSIVRRIEQKLCGRDIEHVDHPLTVDQQVTSIVSTATNIENLCQLYTGWCPQW